jgi:peptide/nickel transport system substrate-binding protein
MMKYKALSGACLAGAAALAVTACGSSGSGGSGSKGSSSGTSSTASSAPKIPLKAGENALDESISGGKKGGTLTVLSSENFSHLDPGQAYFSLDYGPVYSMQRPLLTYMPNSQTQLAPDLATAVPSTSNGGISDGGKTITVHIQPNVKYAPPVNRTVTSSDVKFAIERLANKNVASGYFGAYFKNFVVGAANATGGNISGIVTPNKTTIVFHLTGTVANTVVQALSLPGTAPVPRSVVGPLDKSAPTKFGVSQLTATGPYMVKGEGNGNSITSGFNPEKSLELVRNPNWSASTYAGPYKPPALLNAINIQNGGDPSVIGPQVLKGSDVVQLDTPSRATVQQAYTKYPSQITFTTGAGDHYLTLNNSHGVFTNVNIRRAVYANLDRSAIIKEKGGELTGSPGTHFITPGTAGFTQAGGYPGPKVAWNEYPSGNLKVAESYMKKAGYSSGKYTGGKTAEIVSSNNGADELAINQLVQKDFNQLGIKTHLIQVDQSVMYEKYCQVPKAEVDACPSGGWIRDFNDPYSILYPTFSSKVITPTANENFGQVRDKTLDNLMAKALATTNPTQNAQAWAKADERIVDQAEVVPEDFDIQPNVFAKNVHWNVGSVDLSYTGLK